jgi:hypothetical protein
MRTNSSRRACYPCFKSKSGCGDQRPCSRCIRKEIQHMCVDRPVSSESNARAQSSFHMYKLEYESKTSGKFVNVVSTFIQSVSPMELMDFIQRDRCWIAFCDYISKFIEKKALETIKISMINFASDASGNQKTFLQMIQNLEFLNERDKYLFNFSEWVRYRDNDYLEIIN